MSRGCVTALQSEQQSAQIEAKNKISRPGSVVHACNPALWEAEVGASPEVRSLRPAWPTW